MILFILINLFSMINGQFYLSDICLMTFDNASVSSYPNASNESLLICPSSCYTNKYRSDYSQYPVYGNETYSGNSLVCKCAMHDGRVAPWNGENCPVLFQRLSVQSSIYPNTLRNGILSSKSTSSLFNAYVFVNSRINETSIENIAIEHRGYLYSNNQTSSITCRSQNNQIQISPIEIDQGWKIWNENRLKYFTFPANLSRNDALSFCNNNNGTLMFWFNATEQNLLENELRTTVYQLFRYQRNSMRNNTLTFYIGLKRINQVKQWENNVIDYNDNVFNINVNSNGNGSEDYCTIVQISPTNSPSFQILSYRCSDELMGVYPLCRLNPSHFNEDNQLIYRLDKDTQSGNLTGVINFCSEFGGYPIYANNAYEWQLIQEIMLKDASFNEDYVYTGLISQSKQVRDAYWMPRNVSYNWTLNYIWFASDRGSDRIGYHLSKSSDESYYGLYDINPYTVLNDLRFCRKDNLRRWIKDSSSCSSKQCQSISCLNQTLPNQSDNLRFAFYSCLPANSLASIVYTHAFPIDGDFVRPSLPMDYSVSLRRNYANSLRLSLNQTDVDLRSNCYEYLNMDNKNTLNDTIQLLCDSSNPINKTIQGISFKRGFNGLVSVGLTNRRISSHHFRFIDSYLSSSECNSQGISHPYVHQCICAPGFYGQQCQYSCPAGYYGHNCDYQCSGDDDYCKGLLICLPDPYGCSCYSGWYGTNCDRMCPSNRYGADCSYECLCSTCNRFTGVCNCEGTECYQGPITRNEIESRCRSSSNLALLIAVPIACVLVVVLIIGALLFWKKKHQSDEENLFPTSNIRSSQRSIQSSSTANQFDNYIISERL